MVVVIVGVFILAGLWLVLRIRPRSFRLKAELPLKLGKFEIEVADPEPASAGRRQHEGRTPGDLRRVHRDQLNAVRGRIPAG